LAFVIRDSDVVFRDIIVPMKLQVIVVSDCHITPLLALTSRWLCHWRIQHCTSVSHFRTVTFYTTSIS